MSQLDPFTTCYKAIRAAFLAWPPFVALVKPGNLPDMSATTFERFKSEIAPADTPEVILLQGQFKLMPFGVNSKVVSFNQNFPLIATQDTLRLIPLNNFKYEVMRALLKSNENFGLSFVRTWDFSGGADDAFGQQEWKRGTMRYVTTLQINVQMDLERRLIFAGT